MANMSYGVTDKIVMTPLSAEEGKVIQVARVPENRLKQSSIELTASGSASGIIVNKPSKETPNKNKPHTERKFTAFLRDEKKKAEIKEKRSIKFWFQMYISKDQYEKIAEKFFTTLLNPNEFPTDYVGYVQRILRLARDYDDILTLEIEMRPPRPGEDEKLKLPRRQTMRIKSPGGESVTIMQDDHHIYREEDEIGEGGVYDNTAGSRSIRYGSTLNRSDRNVTSQDDQLRQQRYTDQADGERLHGVYSPDSMSPTASGNNKYRYGSQDHYELPFRNTATNSTLSLGDYPIYGGSSRSVRRGPKLSKQGHMIIWIAKKQKLLNVLEDAYPNSMQSEQLARMANFKRQDLNRIPLLLKDLQSRSMINDMGNGNWLRIQKLTQPSQEQEGGKPLPPEKVHKVQYVPHIPSLTRKQQPTIAVITLLYCEKLAVDSMIDFKTTYVRYKTEGEGQVYTIGTIGDHKVVTTKLSRIGYGEGAKTAAGNSVTRLLGTFPQIEHVVLVGVGGGVPDYYDDNKHIRMGDIVVSKPAERRGPVYIACTGYNEAARAGEQFQHRSWRTKDTRMERLTAAVYRTSFCEVNKWEDYLQESLEELHQHEIRFFRPPPETDKLRRENDKGRMVEVDHPPIAPGSPRDMYPTMPMIHHGPVGSGKILSKSQKKRSMFADQFNVKVIDMGFQAVMDSIEGNRTESFVVVRGISDYVDGSSKKEWQPYAALAASAYMKQLVLKIPAVEDEDEDIYD